MFLKRFQQKLKFLWEGRKLGGERVINPQYILMKKIFHCRGTSEHPLIFFTNGLNQEQSFLPNHWIVSVQKEDSSSERLQNTIKRVP